MLQAYLWLAGSRQVYGYFYWRFKSRGFPLNSSRQERVMGVGFVCRDEWTPRHVGHLVTVWVRKTVI